MFRLLCLFLLCFCAKAQQTPPTYQWTKRSLARRSTLCPNLQEFSLWAHFHPSFCSFAVPTLSRSPPLHLLSPIAKNNIFMKRHPSLFLRFNAPLSFQEFQNFQSISTQFRGFVLEWECDTSLHQPPCPNQRRPTGHLLCMIEGRWCWLTLSSSTEYCSDNRREFPFVPP